jgi:nucleoside-diphosphate-sugar epimerase
MYLIVGGAGFLGAHLVRRLTEMGECVRVFDIRPSTSLPPAVEVVYGDVLDVRSLSAAAQGVRAIFHLAALSPQARAPSELMHGINVGGTANAIRAAIEAGVSRFVLVSSAEVYGYPEQVPVREDAPKEPLGTFGRNKLEAEECCRRAWLEQGLETVILRPTLLVGSGLTDRFLLSLLASMARNQPIAVVGDGRNRFQMTAVEDCAEACRLAATVLGIGGEAFNVGSADPLPFVEQAERVRALTGTRSPLWRVPQEPAATVLRWLGRLHLLPLQPEYIPFLYRDFVLDTSKAREQLAWQPRLSNVDMLVQAYRWYQNRKRPSGRPQEPAA